MLVVILFILLKISHDTSKTKIVEKEAESKPPITPQVIVIDKSKTSTENTDIPVYPKTSPRYSNSNNPSDYQQLGILTSNESDKEPIVLPLFGRKIYGRSDRYQYYTATDKNNMMRIPLTIGNRDCEDTVGCNEIYSGDKLSISIYQGREFTATIYRIEAPRYFASSY